MNVQQHWYAGTKCSRQESPCKGSMAIHSLFIYRNQWVWKKLSCLAFKETIRRRIDITERGINNKLFNARLAKEPVHQRHDVERHYNRCLPLQLPPTSTLILWMSYLSCKSKWRSCRMNWKWNRAPTCGWRSPLWLSLTGGTQRLMVSPHAQTSSRA